MWLSKVDIWATPLLLICLRHLYTQVSFVIQSLMKFFGSYSRSTTVKPFNLVHQNPVFSSMNASAYHLLRIFSSPIKKVQNMTSEILENGLEQLKNITLVPIQEKIDTFSNQTASVLNELQPRQVLNKLTSIMKPSVDTLNTLVNKMIKTQIEGIYFLTSGSQSVTCAWIGGHS